VLSEVEHVCDRVGILRSGRLVMVAELEELRGIRIHRVEIKFAEGSEVPAERLTAARGVDEVVVRGHSVTCTVQGSFDGLLEVISGAAVLDLVSTEPGLEEVFLSFFGPSKPKALPP
jgi:ABC-2 type transport system ATP-binding protein